MNEVVLSEQEIAQIVERLGHRITEDLKDEKRPPVFLCVMKGAMPFFVDLVKQVKREVICDYIQIKSYDGDHSTGTVRVDKDISIDLNDRVVVVVEDIVDTGLSMQFLISHIRSRFHPKKILVAALFDKALCRKVDVEVDYVGHVLSDSKFLVGYGLDYKEIYRNVPYVYVPSPVEIEECDKISD